MVEITEIDRDEALRYLCCHDENNIGETAGKYLDECESRLLGVILAQVPLQIFSPELQGRRACDKRLYSGA